MREESQEHFFGPLLWMIIQGFKFPVHLIWEKTDSLLSLRKKQLFTIHGEDHPLTCTEN
jgi:hypothetical protein